MPTITPNMGLTLPDIITANTLGTPIQDWCLYINSNIVTIDGHDHAQKGKQIPSTALTTGGPTSLNGVNIAGIQYVTLPADTIDPTTLSIYTDGTDLFYLDGTGVLVQITISGALNVASSIGGFFGDYAASGTNAFLDGVNNVFGFNGPGPGNPDSAKITCLNLSYFDTLPSLNLFSFTMPSNFDLNFTNATFVFPSANAFPTHGIVTNINAGNPYQISNVIGDGSAYSATLDNVPITDPNGIYHFNSQDCVDPGPVGPYVGVGNVVHQAPTIQNSNFQEVFASTVRFEFGGSYFSPGTQYAFTAKHVFTELNKIPFFDGTFSLHTSKCSIAIVQNFTPIDPWILFGLAFYTTSVVYTNDLVNPPYFTVNGYLINTTNQGISSNPAFLAGQSNLWITAVFPKFNSSGVFFGSKY